MAVGAFKFWREQTRPPQLLQHQYYFGSLFWVLFPIFLVIIHLSHPSTSLILVPFSRMNGSRIVPNTRYSLPLQQRRSTVRHSQPCSSLGANGKVHDNNTTPPPTTSFMKNPLTELGLPQPILLGSASFTRKLILQEMNIPFHKVVRAIDERALGDRSQDPPHDLVLMLAHAKMDHLVKELQQGNIDKDELPSRDGNYDDNGTNGGWILLTADQVVTCKGNILEKPASIEEAKTFVQQYGTYPPSTVGSCVLHHIPSNIRVAGVDTATIHFDPTTLTDMAAVVLVDTLVEQGEPIMSCAGGLMIEHPLVQEHVLRIDGTQDSVMGLSKPLVSDLLQQLSNKLVMESKS